MLSKLTKSGSVLQLGLRYAAEIIIIFLGITISFLFDQWREEQQQKRDLIELSQSLLTDVESLKAKLKNDRAGSETWISELDSIRTQRTSKQISERQLSWLYRVITGQTYFLFEPHSPTYLSAVNSTLYSELPDTIRNELYSLYQVRLPLFQMLYNQQQENITHFRQYTVVSTDVYLYHADELQLLPDWQKLAREIQRPAYGNFINQVILMEKEVYKLNESSFELLTSLENNLSKYIDEMKSQ